MTHQNPPLRLLRLVLITLLLLGAIAMLVPEEAHTVGVDVPVDTLAASGASATPN